MFEQEAKVKTITATIDVKNVIMPKPEDYKFYLDLWQQNSNIARKHEVLLWGEEHFVLIERYIQTLSELGQKAISVIVSEIPWSGQNSYRDVVEPSDFFEYSMIKAIKGKDGKFSYDFCVMQRYIDLCFQYNIKDEIEVFGLINIWQAKETAFVAPSDYPDGIRVRYFDESDGCYKYLHSANEVKAYIKALEAYFAEHGYIDLVSVVADEPENLEEYRKTLSTLKEVAPAFL